MPQPGFKRKAVVTSYSGLSNPQLCVGRVYNVHGMLLSRRARLVTQVLEQRRGTLRYQLPLQGRCASGHAHR